MIRGELVAVCVLSIILAAVLRHQGTLSQLSSAAEDKTLDGTSAADSPAVLFIGNSFTSVNDLPRTLARLTRSLGGRVFADSYAPGGQTFEGHSKDPELLKKIQSRDWDFVVLQEQSQRPAFGQAQVEAQTITPALRLAGLIRAAHPAAKVVFYETWGRKDGDQPNCKELPDICTYEGMQNRLDESYRLMALRSSGLLAPVGEAWARVRASSPSLELYSGDGIHPSTRGTYLAACVFCATLLQRGVTGAAALGLDRREALLLQKAAEAAVFRRRVGLPAAGAGL